jgi:hypothetical protein
MKERAPEGSTEWLASSKAILDEATDDEVTDDEARDSDMREEPTPPPKTKKEKKHGRSKKHNPPAIQEDPDHGKTEGSPQNGAGISIPPPHRRRYRRSFPLHERSLRFPRAAYCETKAGTRRLEKRAQI